MFDRNPIDMGLLRKILEEIKQEAVEVVNIQLSRFRDVKQMGKAYFFC